jgi:2-octaprenyl-6-methoxyphenol hydroxylase
MARSSNLKAEILIAGAGLVGLIQTLHLSQNGFNVICVDQGNISAINAAQHDMRTTAISYGSHLLLKEIGVWEGLLAHACPINDIQILDGSSSCLLDFNINEVKNETANDKSDNNAPAFGWIIENYLLRQVLYRAIEKESKASYRPNSKISDYSYNDETITTILEDTEIETTLVIGADGRGSFTREWMEVGAKEWSYNQEAIVSIITHEKPHHNIAVEHFKQEGPFAVLPMMDDDKGMHRSSIVWTQHKNKKSAAHFDEKTFLQAMNARLPDFYGQATQAQKIAAYPLTFNHAYGYVAPRIALIGDAAHGIHPIAGQGLNLGLRDVVALTASLKIAKEQGDDIGAIEVLKQYQRTRKPDNIKMAAATDLLNKLFSNNILPLKKTRQFGLKIINRIKPAKTFFMKQAMGLQGQSKSKKKI